MTGSTKLLCVIALVSFAAAQTNRPANDARVRLVLSEVEPGVMASEQYCILVYADHRFHSEKASRKIGRDRDRKVYEGELSEADWKTLDGILENKQFQEIDISKNVMPMVVDNAHTYTISVARDGKYQNMEFLDNKSRKPYEPQLKPLLSWWKSVRGRHMAESEASPDPKCALDSTHPVFAN